jgi:hypothetical protein
VQAHLPPGLPFMDEHRRVQLTVLCQLRIIKRDILERFATEGRPVDATVLVGTRQGPDTGEIVERLGELLAQQAALAVGNGAQRIRAVIPCNTLGTMVEALGCDLAARGEPAVRIDLQAMQPLVLRALQRQGVGRLRVLGTPSSVAAYRAVLAAGQPGPALEDTPEEQVAAYEACIVAAIQGLDYPAAQLTSLHRAAEHARGLGVTTLEACTDLVLGLGHDALEIYAAELVGQIYPSATR